MDILRHISPRALAEDMLGSAALVILLVAGLHLPVLI